MGTRRIIAAVVVAIALGASACGRDHDATPTTPTPTSGIALFSGSWTSLPAAAVGVCNTMTYTVAPTGATTGTITYAATCSGVPVSGTGTGTVDGTTLNWTTSGNAAACPFVLGGTAVPDTASTMKVTYTGTVCGAPVSGTDTLRR
jgi:hypothetical protein